MTFKKEVSNSKSFKLAVLVQNVQSALPEQVSLSYDGSKLLRSSKFWPSSRIALQAIMVTCTAEILLISSLIDVCVLHRFQRRRRPDDESPRQKTILETLIRQEGPTHTSAPSPHHPPLYPYLTRPISDGPKPRAAHWVPPPPTPTSHPPCYQLQDCK